MDDKKTWMIEKNGNKHILSSTLDALPSGKHTKNYGKSPFLMGKSTINGPFSIAFCMFTRG